jgi:hypothetical protein
MRNKQKKKEAMRIWRLKHIDESRKQSLDYYYEHLKECQERAKKYYHEHKKELNKKRKVYADKNFGRAVYYDIKRRCNKKHIFLKMTINEFLIWYYSQIRQCEYCGILEEDWCKCKDSLTKFYYRLQVDRKNNEKGYEIKNLVLACPRCNFTKSDFFSYKDMLKIGERIYANQQPL